MNLQMFIKVTLITMCMLFSTLSLAATHLIDLPLDATGFEYRSHLNSVSVPLSDSYEANDAVEPVIKMGERNLKWLEHINQFLQKKISISSPDKMQAFPISSPRIYNEAIVLEEFEALKADMPRPMFEVLFNNKAFTDMPPIEQELYEIWALKVDRSYQIAARWRMMQPYLSQLAARKSNDVRGFYFLKGIEQLDEKLKDFKNLKSDETELYKIALIRLCINSNISESSCESRLNSAIQNNSVLNYKSTYWQKSLTVWSSYFEIPNGGTYPAMKWLVSKPDEARVPFKRPQELALQDFLKLNIEDEWQWGAWKLVVDFDLASLYAIDVRFVPGVTPHVPGLGSNIIYMDANSPLTEWDVQWTIRHEFGHNLGFPDCYHEFYDRDSQKIIGYQIDIDDLMCSRRGKLKERHYEELKATYF